MKLTELQQMPGRIQRRQDQINEVLENEIVIRAFQKYLGHVLIRGATLSPIPKSSSLDKRIPLNYRGISLLCTSAKKCIPLH